MLSVSKSPSIDFSRPRRIASLRPSGASVCTHHAVVEVIRERLACPPSSRPIDFTGLTSLLAVPARSADLSKTSAWKTLLGPVTIFFGVSRMRLPLLSTALRIWIRICSSEVCDRLAAVLSWFEKVPLAIGCALLTSDTPSPPANALLKARLRMFAPRVSLVSISDWAR